MGRDAPQHENNEAAQRNSIKITNKTGYQNVAGGEGREKNWGVEKIAIEREQKQQLSRSFIFFRTRNELAEEASFRHFYRL